MITFKSGEKCTQSGKYRLTQTGEEVDAQVGDVFPVYYEKLAEAANGAIKVDASMPKSATYELIEKY